MTQAHQAQESGDLAPRSAIGKLNNLSYNSSVSKVFQPEKGVTGIQSYIVQLVDQPIAAYEGGVKGFSATAAPQLHSMMVRGRVDAQSTNAQAYKSYLLDKQQSFMSKAQSVGIQAKLKRQFSLASNSMVVEMTQDDAIKMAKQAGVKRITPNRILHVQTDRGPEFIHADKLWDGTTSPDGVSVQGEGMLVGIIDTGINTEHPAFADDGSYAATNPFGADHFIGDCEEDASLCNNKLVGLRHYAEITDTYTQMGYSNRRPANAVDHNGHGSHTASTVAGNYLTDTPLQTSDGSATSHGIDLPFQFPHTSGVAPKAHIIAYQVCLPGKGGADQFVGCPESAILSAFEDAINDGVDAINFSIGGGESFPWDDPMELAFLAARKAGISVAAAAGNSGPSFFTADHSSPWVTTVGASTHDRVMSVGDKTIDAFEGDAPSYRIPSTPINGKGYGDGVSGEFVLAEDYPDPNPSDGYTVASCNAPFPAGTFTADQVVICERGDIARVDKAKNVAAGGAGGLVLQNLNYSDALVADNFVIPGINVASSARYTLRNWVKYSAKGTARATISASSNTYEFDASKGNMLASFSSMGPSRYISSLVPDLTAPGVDIYAANSIDQPFTNYPSASDWTFMSGTSMATPHVTGAMTLLMELHKDWTPAEIQSALMMTAEPVKVQVSGQVVETPYNIMAGAGAINVESAAKAGLVMDETYENYVDANPHNGGDETWLNTASMVQMRCQSSCTWMRTVTATQDGVWNAEGVGKEEGVEITVTPSHFTLKKGESQALMVTAQLPSINQYKVDPSETGAPWSVDQNNGALFNGQVKLTEVNGKAPDAHLPVVAVQIQDQMPVSLDLDVHRNQGHETIRVNTDAYSQFRPRYYGLVKPTTYDVELPHTSVFLNPTRVKNDWDQQVIEVPEGTKRLMVKVLSSEKTSTLDNPNPRYWKAIPWLMLGRDKNGNGGFISEGATQQEMMSEYWDEMVCQSLSGAEENLCSIVDPTPGTYYISTLYTGGETGVRAKVGYAIIKDGDDEGNLSIDAPASHDGNGDYNISLNWQLPEATKDGDLLFGGFDAGSAPGAEGDMGFTSVNINRGVDDVSWTVSQDKAKVMDVIKVNLKLQPNLETDDRSYDWNLTLPEGMRLAPATITSNNEEVAAAIVADEHGLHISGTQLSTRGVQRDYIMTTNLTDKQCHTPLIDDKSTGGYIDLHGEFGLQPMEGWFVGNYRNYFDVPIEYLFYKAGAEFKMYNQDNGGFLRMYPVGAFRFNTGYWLMNAHRGPGFLDEALSPFWRGTFEAKYRRDPSEPWGLTIADQYAAERPDLGDLAFMEFDNITDSSTGDEYDFEMILRSGIDFHKNMPEIIYAYDNLGANLAKGAVFVEGFDSPYSSNAGPKGGNLHEVLGFDNLDEKLKNDLVVCFDYDGPEKSEVNISFLAAVQPEAIGKDLDISFEHALQGQDTVTEHHTLTVNSNIKVAALQDMTVAEDGRLDGINVAYVDVDKVPDSIEVSGEHVTAEVEGDSFNLIPDADFNGETEVTVTVRDTANAGDAANTSFMLSVTPVEDAPVASLTASATSITEGDSLTLDASGSMDVDGDALTYSWAGDNASGTGSSITVEGLSAGEHEFTLTVSDGQLSSSANVTVTVNAAPTETQSSDNGGGGSMGLFGLLGLAALAGRRRRH
ncbi:S8 family serine peptidase [Gallaecimonas kandeliae]|uniref:S8 family serine peptidase n=1 Tax=Gallaecimonas kandeliae TaxID=3029055 RepID=UPI002649496B|nr:S8 family serine peptidase [Gallaecimonas kandeliae]WKE66001.1 S8 family serine peptidase [Gallaecimonas kandeliae]